MAKEIKAFGEVMLRLMSPKGEKILSSHNLKATFGGSECNVLVSLANMGLKTGFITLLPQNDITKAFIKELKSYDVDTMWCLPKDGRFGVYYIEPGSNMRGAKVIYDRDYTSISLGKKGDIDWQEAFKNTCWYHISGITPAISESLCGLASESLSVANKLNIPISLDLNYREKLWTWGEAQSVMPSFAQKADLIIGTGEDYDLCLNIKGNYPKEISQKAKEKYPNAKVIAIINVSSKSSDYKIWTASMIFGEKYYESNEYTIYDIEDGIGGGDAFSAGLIYGFLNFTEGEKIINFATCAGLMKYTFTGDYNMATSEEILNIMKNSEGNISR